MYSKMNKKHSTVKRRSEKSASIKDHPNIIEVASQLSILIESVKCSICLEVMISPARIKCGHTFCTLCIENAIQFNKAGVGTELRKLSGGSAKANCPLCKASNINKRSITGDPVLEEKIKIIKELQESLKNDAKELGFDLNSIKPTTLSRGMIEGLSGLTPAKKAIAANNGDIIKNKNLNELFNTPKGATKTMKTYGRKNENMERKSNIARHFKMPQTSNIYDNIYDDLTDASSQDQIYSKTPANQNLAPNLNISPSLEPVFESCPKSVSEKAASKHGTKTPDYSNQDTLDNSSSSLTLRSISPSLDNFAPRKKEKCVSPILQPQRTKNIRSLPLKVLDQSVIIADSNSSLDLHTISPRPKKLGLNSKEKEKLEPGTCEMHITPPASKKDVKKDILTNTSSSLSLRSTNSPPAIRKRSMKVCEEDIAAIDSVMNDQAPKMVDHSNLNADSNSSLALHTISPCPKRLKKMSKSEDKENLDGISNMQLTSKKTDVLINSDSSLSLHSNLPSKERGYSSNVNISSSKNKRKAPADAVSILKLDKHNEVSRKPDRFIPFMIKGNHWRTSVFGSQNKTNVVFLKMGNIAPNEKVDFSITNSTKDDITLAIEARLHNDPNKSGIVLETETSSSTQNTQGNSHAIHNHQSLFGNEDEKPTVDDFDMSEEEINIMAKSEKNSNGQLGGIFQQNDCKSTEEEKQPSISHSNDKDGSMDDMEEFVNMDDPFSIDESDDDLFEATPENTFRPLNTSTTKSNKKMLSQSPMNILKWKDFIQRNREETLLENFEIALHGDFGNGIKSGEAYPSKPELWQLLTLCGATVYKSVNLFTFARGVTGLCIVSDAVIRDSGYKQGSTRINDYNRIFACSDVAVIEKEWVLRCLLQNKLVSILPFLKNTATEEELRKLDYGDLL